MPSLLLGPGLHPGHRDPGRCSWEEGSRLPLALELSGEPAHVPLQVTPRAVGRALLEGYECV